ncbi:hypothetical protein ARMGADRAFT_900336, partial [Armillaria gallica]
INLPTECDDEYWEHPNLIGLQTTFWQAVNCIILEFLPPARLIMVCMRTIYSIHKSKALFVLKKNREPQVITELDLELNKWVNSIPHHRR